MILGIGVDIVEIDRIRQSRERQGERFFEMVFLPDEAAYCRGKANLDQHLAVRFAAKEAVMKALGTGWSDGVTFRGIEVVREGDGAPRVVLHGKTKARAGAMGVQRAHLSLSHTERYAVAQVVLEGESP